MPFTIYSEKRGEESARQFAYRTLQRNILLLDMFPGEPISEKEIAASLGLSRTPVREALLDLCRERLIEIYPQRGTRVALMDARLVEQGRFLRETVELAILELACQNCGDEEISKLEKSIQVQRQQAENDELIKFFQEDSEFHRLLYEGCGKDTVYDATSFYLPHFIRERMLRLKMFNLEELLCDHENILDAIKKGDCRSAKVHLKQHLDRVMCDQKILVEAYPKYFV
ncbi:MAG: GntR family transcriptional regulator [Sphaerochaetaceae bacterium]